MSSYKSYEVPVTGGQVHVGHWGDNGPIIFAIHGITASHVSWLSLADQISTDCQLIAIDLRGRGKSADIAGPWGLVEHVSDVISVLDYLGLRAVDILIGHSMGGFVSAILGAEHPNRFNQIVFLDGGIPVIEKLPKGVTPEQLVHAILGPSLARLEMAFESEQAYLNFWRALPVSANGWSKYVEECALYELVGDAPNLKSGMNKAAIIGDVESQFASDVLQVSLQKLTHPLRFIRAEFGINEPVPLYSQQIVDMFIKQYSGAASSCTFNGRNHFNILVSSTGAKMLATELRYLLNTAQ